MATATQSVRDIASENPSAIRVFEKYGIEYCCGGQAPLAEACAAKGVSVDEVMASLEAAVPAAPGEKDWAKESLADLATHIVNTHHAYVNREMPRLNELAAKVVSRHGDDTRQELAGIQGKLGELGEELTAHQGKEEVVLFPYIGKLERFAAGDGAEPRNCFGTIANPIAMMTKDHDVAGKLMAEIRKLSGDYAPPVGACPTFRAFYAGLEEFERDLHRHVHLENNILFPRALALENSAAG